MDRFLSSTKLIIDKQINEIISSGKNIPVITEEQKKSIQEQLLGPSTFKEDDDIIVSSHHTE